MAVQAQHLSQELLRSSGVIDEQQLRLILLKASNNPQMTVFSGQQSELTSNNPSRKRTRDDSSNGGGLVYYGDTLPEHSAITTSTSGRCQTSPDFVSTFHYQTLEIDALLRLQNERLRSGLEEASKRQCRTLISAMEKHLHQCLLLKQSELNKANQKNLELEHKLKQLAAENQIWFNVAKNNESIVASLKATLDQALHPAADEGYGDTSSCCDEPSKKGGCRGCGDGEISVLLFPCRHLCLCQSCAGTVDVCPVCELPTSASIPVFLPE